MDTLTFIAALVESLAWPLAAVVMVLLFREPFTRILRSVRRLKYGEVEVDVERELQEIEQRADEAQIPVPEVSPSYSPALSPPDNLAEQIREIAQIAPAAAIAFAWSTVDRKLQATVAELIPDTEKPRRFLPGHAIRLLRERGLLDAPVSDTLERMRHLKNRVTHGDETEAAVDAQEAIGYGRVAVGIIEYLDSLIRYQSSLQRASPPA